jgi:Carboxypeptidase regulatory-like domain
MIYPALPPAIPIVAISSHSENVWYLPSQEKEIKKRKTQVESEKSNEIAQVSSLESGDNAVAVKTQPIDSNKDTSETKTPPYTTQVATPKNLNNIQPAGNYSENSVPVNTPPTSISQNIKGLEGTFLVGVIINRREVGTLDIRLEKNTVLVPIDAFAEIADFKVEKIDNKTLVKTRLGEVELTEGDFKKIDGIAYITDALLKEKFSIIVNFKPSDLVLNVDLPWRSENAVSSLQQAQELQPEVRPPLSGFSNLRQELYLTSTRGDTNLRSSTLLGGRLGGGLWRARLNNNFESQPDISEYYFFKRDGQLRYQLGRQQIGLHPLLNGLDLTGAQFGLTNLPADRFYDSYGAAELLPRRSRPLESFRGEVPPASFVQLKVAGIPVAQQQVGLNGIYEFSDINLPVGNNNEIELLVYDRNNLSVPIEVRSLRLNASDLLLPGGGNVQLAGLGLSGNLAQNALFNGFNSDAGKLVGFYQFRQGLSNNLTFEGAVQAIPDNLQAQAGFVWRLANPIILATSLGTSRGQLGYTTDLNINLGQLEILGNSQLFPNGYNINSQSRDRFNHSLEANYRLGNNFNFGVIARSRQDSSTSANYIAPTFLLNPFPNLSLRGRPDIEGRYLFSAFYQPSSASRLSFNTFGDVYTSDFSYNLNRAYQLSFGSEFGGILAPRYSASLNYNASSLDALSWKLGLAYNDGEVAPIVGASMRVLPGLFARVEYQGIPSRSRNAIGGFGDDRLTVSLVSDLSFTDGNISPIQSSGLGRERGAVAGKIAIPGAKKKFDLSGAIIRVSDRRNRRVGGAVTDSNGKFYIGNLPEGNHIVEVEAEGLPVELTLVKTSIVAEVAPSAVTQINFPMREEYGMAGRITDLTGQPIAEVQLELVNEKGARVFLTTTDQFGLYRLDGIPVGKYTLQIPTQDAIETKEILPKRDVEISSQFVYDQNLKLPISTAAKKTKSQ